MQLLSLNFLLYSIGGVWRPLDWSSRRSKLLYSMYTVVVIYLLIYLILNHTLDIILVVNNVEDFALASFILFSVIAVLSKAIIAIRRRDSIINLIEILQKKPCKACNEEESDIHEKFDRFIRLYSIRYIALASASVSSTAIKVIFEGFKGILPYNLWVPWDCTSLLVFWLTFLQEIIALLISTIINAASETLIFGSCLQICAQFEILKHRLQKIKSCEKKEIRKDSFNVASSKTSSLSEHIAHHLCIIRLAKMINDIFSEVIFIQFFSSILILCLSLYYLSSHATMVNVVTWMSYIICMYVQIFVYCWAGNEVTLQSIKMSEAAYHMDWTSMTVSEQKDLLMIMKHSTRPFKFTSSFLVTLSLESYATLVKASYSAFNILQTS